MFVDSNIFIYANDSHYPEHENARGFFEKSSEKLYFNTIIALESHYGYLRNLGFTEAERILKAMFESRILTFCDIEKDDILEGAKIAGEYSLRSNDAAIIANMLRNGIKTIATDNVRDFSKHPDIKVENPIRRIRH